MMRRRSCPSSAGFVGQDYRLFQTLELRARLEPELPR